MSHDTIVDEVRRHRNEYAKGFNFDLQAIYHDLKAQQEKSGRRIVSLKPRPVKTITAIQHER